MSAKQTPMLLGRLVEHQTHFDALPVKDAQWAIQNPKDAATLCVTAIKGRQDGAPKPERTYKLLQPLTQLASEPTTFKADDTFFTKKTGVKITYVGDNFKSWFAGKVEESVEPAQLSPFKLTKDALGRDIIAELGGEEAAEVNLVDVWRLMERQANGENGALLTNGWSNIFYVRDKDNVLRAVGVDWDSNGWGVGADVLAYNTWRADCVVFSRNS